MKIIRHHIHSYRHICKAFRILQGNSTPLTPHIKGPELALLVKPQSRWTVTDLGDSFVITSTTHWPQTRLLKKQLRAWSPWRRACWGLFLSKQQPPHTVNIQYIWIDDQTLGNSYMWEKPVSSIFPVLYIYWKILIRNTLSSDFKQNLNGNETLY